MTVGFIALWKNNQREYTASPRDEWGTNDAIQAAFANGRDRETVPTGSTTAVGLVWQYLTFWISPGMDAVFDTIADLEQAGDFKFADSWHIFGRYRDDPSYLTDGAWDVFRSRLRGNRRCSGWFCWSDGMALPLIPNPCPYRNTDGSRW